MIDKLRKLLPKSQFGRGVSVLVGGTTVAQTLMVLAAPLLTRLYTPEDFGLLAVYSGLLALFTVVASLRYELAIPLPQSNTEAVNILVLSVLAVMLMSGISFAMVLVAGEHIANALDTPKILGFFWLLPVGVFLSGIYNVCNYWTIRTKAFGDVARTQISQTLVTLAVQLSAYTMGGIALLFAQVGGQGIGSFMLARSAVKHKEFKSWSWLGVWQAAKRYKNFPIFSTWSGLFNTAGTQLPPLMFAALFNAGAAGLYALANRILQLPMTILGGAIGQVYFSDLAEAKYNGYLNRKIEEGSKALIKLSFPGGLIFMLFAPELFAWIFGPEWKVAGEIARWMVPWILFQFVSSPLSVIYFVLEKEQVGLIFQAGMLFARTVSLVIGYAYLDFVGSVILFSITSAICYFFYTLSIYYVASSRFVFLLRVLFIELLKLGIVLIIIFFLSHYSERLAMLISMFILIIFYIPRLRKLNNNRQ